MPLVRCAYDACGNLFQLGSRPRRFCCEACRRAYQNEMRREARAEERAAREAGRPMLDPWERNDLEDAETLWANALIDAIPPGAEQLRPRPPLDGEAVA